MKNRINANMKQRFKNYGTKNIDRAVTLYNLFNRFNGKCQDCGIKTKMGIHPTVDESATMEHVTPLSMGGDHTWDNVELLCQKCNFARNKSTMAKKNEHLKQKHILRFGAFGYVFKVEKETI